VNIIIPDSGKRREFSTGAHRDSADDKGRMDLIPLDIAARIVEDDEEPDRVMCLVEEFKKTNETKYLTEALRESVGYLNLDSPEDLLLEASYIYKGGALKYGENNWKLGMDVKIYIDSGMRHYAKARRGDDDENHIGSFAWNLIGAIWTVENVPGSRYQNIIEKEPGVPYERKDSTNVNWVFVYKGIPIRVIARNEKSAKYKAWLKHRNYCGDAFRDFAKNLELVAIEGASL